MKRNAFAATIRNLLQLGLLGLTSLLLCDTQSAQAQDSSNQAIAHPAFKWAGTEPLVLLTEYNPWAMAIGSDTPTFALYADGTVIYWHGDRRSGYYVAGHLASSHVAQLFDNARLKNIGEFKACYSIEDATDQPTNVLVVKTEQGYKTIEVYGVIRNTEKIPTSRLPTDLQIAFRTLLAFETTESHPWQPTYFEAIIWPFTYAKSSVRWPASFPGVSDKNTKATRNGFRIYLPIADLDAYKAFVGNLKPTQAVLLDGRKWTVSARFPFPHEGAVGKP